MRSLLSFARKDLLVDELGEDLNQFAPIGFWQKPPKLIQRDLPGRP
jgi:hypothetical protein